MLLDQQLVNFHNTYLNTVPKVCSFFPFRRRQEKLQPPLSTKLLPASFALSKWRTAWQIRRGFGGELHAFPSADLPKPKCKVRRECGQTAILSILQGYHRRFPKLHECRGREVRASPTFSIAAFSNAPSVLAPLVSPLLPAAFDFLASVVLHSCASPSAGAMYIRPLKKENTANAT